MKASRLMRVLFFKIQRPFICFCKPPVAAAHIYTSGLLKLENTTPHVPSAAFPVSDASDEPSSGIRQECVNGQQGAEDVPRSCIKKLPQPRQPDGHVEVVEKKRVQWMDDLGEELTQIKEFESSETWDADSDENSRCLCIIL